MTKNFKSYVLSALAVAAIAFSGCSKSDEGMTPAQKKDFSVVLSGASTKTTNNGMKTLWAADDAINLFHSVAGEETPTYVSDGEFTTTEAGATATFTGTLAEGFDDTKTYNWYAFYPYKSQITTPASTSGGWTYIGCRSDKAQTQTGNNSTAHISGANYPIAGVASKLPGTEKPVFNMRHLSALVAVKVKNGTSAPITVSRVSITTDGEDIVGQYYIDFTNPISPSFTKGDYVSTTANLDVTDGEEIAAGGTATFYLAVKPFTLNSGDKFTVGIMGSNGLDEKTITASDDFTFTAGKIKTINYTYTKSTVTYSFTTIAELNAIAEETGNTEVTKLGKLTNAVVSFVPGTSDAIIKDATGSVIYHKKDHGLKQGQTYTGDITVNVLMYNNLYSDITSIGSAVFTGTGAVIEPETLTLSQLTGNYSKYQNTYSKLENLDVVSVSSSSDKSDNITVTDGTNNYVIFTYKFPSGAVAGDKVTAVGTITKYNTTEELKVWAKEDISVTHVKTKHKINFTQPEGGTITVKVEGNSITSGTEVMEDTEVSLVATNYTGFNFNRWTVEGATVSDETSSTATFTVGASDVTISASFLNASTSVTVTYDFTSASAYPEGFPTATGTKTSSPTTFTLDGKSIVLYAPNAYYMMTNGSAKTLFFGKSATSFGSTAYIEVPAKEGYYIKSISVKNSSGCAVDVSVNIYNTSGTTVSTAVKTVKGGTMNFDISPHTTNVPYRIASLASGKNFQFDSIVIVYNK